jgi:hypothetical protein
MSSEWDRAHVKVTVEEIVDKPSTSPVDAPGTVITWQEAQRRVDAGLAVETLVYEHQPNCGWALLDDDRIAIEKGKVFQPTKEPGWTYRIPLQPVEAVTTVANVTADEWIKELERELSESRAASKGLEKACDGLRRELAQARADLQDWKPLICWAQKLTGAPLKPEPCSRYALSEINELGNRLRSALGSQKAAVAALEVERVRTKALRSALEDLLDMVHCEAAQNADRVLNETAGKESGG